MIPQVYRKDRENIIASYDAIDIASGTGFINYYLCASTDSGGIDYFITDKTLSSYPIGVSLNGATSQENNYDILFNKPQEIKGTSFVNFTQFVGAGSTVKAEIKIYHVNLADAETEIGAGTSATRTGSNTWRETMLIDLTQKHFGTGEKLRVSVNFVHTGGNSGNYWFDPSSSLTKTDDLTRTVGTDFKVNIPFKLDL